MKIKVLSVAHHRVSSGVSLAYQPGIHTVPRHIGEALIAAGKAEGIPAHSNAKPEE